MKAGIHPEYRDVVFQDVTSDFKILTRSTLSSKETVKWEDGNEYPLIKVEVSSSSHPFYTGQNKVIDTSGRVDKFRKRYAEVSARAACHRRRPPLGGRFVFVDPGQRGLRLSSGVRGLAAYAIIPLSHALAHGPERPRAGHPQRSCVVSELDQITLTAGDKSVAMPVLKPTLGQPCVDIAKLPKETGCFTYDPGFGATASCKSAITYIDGDAGVLLYRGYPIEQLAEHSTFPRWPTC